MKRIALLVLAATVGLVGIVNAQTNWPAKPVRVIVPFAAGGAADVIARLFSEYLGQAFGQQFVVENRAGGGGLIGAQAAARAEPDGYTLMSAGMSSHVLAPSMSKNPGYDPVRDFTPIAYFGGAPSVLLVHPSIDVKSFQDFLAYVRAQSGGIEYVSSGPGTVGNVIVEYVAMKEKLKLAHVPYRAGSGAVVDLLAGRVMAGALNWSTAREHVLAGTLIPVGVSSSRRLPALPNLPTLNEIGYPDMVTTTWHMLAGPAGLSAEIVNAANREVVKIVERPELRRHLDNDAVETRIMTPPELAQFVRSEVDKWAPVVKATVKPE